MIDWNTLSQTSIESISSVLPACDTARFHLHHLIVRCCHAIDAQAKKGCSGVLSAGYLERVKQNPDFLIGTIGRYLTKKSSPG
jgi:hypothetical protein